MIYKEKISYRVASENYDGLYRVTASSHATDSSDNKTPIVDFQRLVEPTMMDM
jgi:hypothetical protein